MNLRALQSEASVWAHKNFGQQPPWRNLMGVMEELGELAHAHLKMDQGIRMNEDHFANKRDAVGDIVIFLANYCTDNGIDFASAVEETWEKVSKRDWTKKLT